MHFLFHMVWSFWFASTRLLGAESGSEVLYMDEEVNFLLLDQVSGDLKEGDRLCLYHSSLAVPYCQAQFRWISRKPLVFLPADMMSRFQVGSRVVVKKIYVSDKRTDGAEYTDATAFGRDYLAKKQGEVRAEQLQTEQNEQPKVPKGGAPHVQADTPVVEGGDFPEIFIPKIRKQKPRAKKETGETAETIAAIKKALKEKSPANYQFLPVRAELTQKEAAEPIDVESTEAEIPPSPLHQAIDVTVLQTMPLLPVAGFQGLRYRTITSDSLNRSSLWVKNSSTLSPVFGTGFHLNLVQSLSRTVGFGWRYHVYDRAQSRATYDDIETRLEARTTTRISAQAVHAEMGWRYDLWDWLTLDTAPGVDLFYSDVWFKAVVVDTSTNRSESLGYAHSSFFFISPRWHSALRMQYRGWGLALGAILDVPVYSFKKNFDGAATASDRLTYGSDPVADLNSSLTHKIRTVGFEAYLGLSYQPQRN